MKKPLLHSQNKVKRLAWSTKYKNGRLIDGRKSFGLINHSFKYLDRSDEFCS